MRIYLNRKHLWESWWAGAQGCSSPLNITHPIFSKGAEPGQRRDVGRIGQVPSLPRGLPLLPGRHALPGPGGRSSAAGRGLLPGPVHATGPEQHGAGLPLQEKQGGRHNPALLFCLCRSLLSGVVCMRMTKAWFQRWKFSKWASSWAGGYQGAALCHSWVGRSCLQLACKLITNRSLLAT